MWIQTAITSIGEIRNILTTLTTKSRSNNAHKKLVIRELRDNLKMFEIVYKKGLSVDALIDQISTEAYQNALKDSFDFGKIKKGKISAELILSKRNKKYINWNTERLIDKIDEKTMELKYLKNLNGGTISNLSSSNTALMLSNQFYRMQLLARFINQD